jgi:hypothetical protein
MKAARIAESTVVLLFGLFVLAIGGMIFVFPLTMLGLGIGSFAGTIVGGQQVGGYYGGWVGGVVGAVVGLFAVWGAYRYLSKESKEDSRKQLGGFLSEDAKLAADRQRGLLERADRARQLKDRRIRLTMPPR